MTPPKTIAALGWLPQDRVAPEDAAWFLGLELEDLHRWRKSGSGPSYERMGSITYRYLAGDLERWRGVQRV